MLEMSVPKVSVGVMTSETLGQICQAQRQHQRAAARVHHDPVLVAQQLRTALLEALYLRPHDHAGLHHVDDGIDLLLIEHGTAVANFPSCDRHGVLPLCMVAPGRPCAAPAAPIMQHGSKHPEV
jgi:hypothetical protein